MSAPKEWVKVSHAANGATSVTVTLQDGNVSARWAVKAYVGKLGPAVKEARAYALTALDDLREALS